jgi:hypothetical protein
MYAANGDGAISLSVDDNMLKSSFFIPSTNRKEDTIAWRQWHHWNKIDSVGAINLSKGIHILKLSTETNGNMNYDFLELKLRR